MEFHRLGYLAMMILFGMPGALSAAPSLHSHVAKKAAVKLTRPSAVTAHGPIDHSGRKLEGRASYYAKHFTNRRMANGRLFDPNSNQAASRTLPFGTTAKVTNLKNGRSALVEVQDRGPYVDGRIVDVTPKVAGQLDMKKAGASPVVVAPIAVPQPDGGVKLGDGAAEVSPQDVTTATKTAQEAAR